MTRTIIILIFLFFVPVFVIAQSGYEKYLNQGQGLFKQQNYLAALEMFDLAYELAKTDKEKSESKEWRRKSKDGIKKQAEDLLNASKILKMAEEQRILALEQKKIALEQQQLAEEARVISLRQKKMADVNSYQAHIILQTIFFYDNRFGLAMKDNLYGFIDKEANTKIDFKYEQATSFDPTGFARVKRDGKNYLIDTTGAEYLLTVNLENIDKNTLAVDLRGWELTKFPNQLLKYPQLKVVLLGDNQLNNIPLTKIGQLNKLQVLELNGNQISKEDIKQLKKLLPGCTIL